MSCVRSKNFLNCHRRTFPTVFLLCVLLSKCLLEENILCCQPLAGKKTTLNFTYTWLCYIFYSTVSSPHIGFTSEKYDAISFNGNVVISILRSYYTTKGSGG